MTTIGLSSGASDLGSVGGAAAGLPWAPAVGIGVALGSVLVRVAVAGERVAVGDAGALVGLADAEPRVAVGEGGAVVAVLVTATAVGDGVGGGVGDGVAVSGVPVWCG